MIRRGWQEVKTSIKASLKNQVQFYLEMRTELLLFLRKKLTALVIVSGLQINLHYVILVY